MSLEKGSKITSNATYEIVEKLGQGNYGTVFLAKHQEIGRDVAVKVLSADKTQLSDLQQEVWIQGKLNHPNIVSVYDFAVSDGKGQLIMEYVEKSLHKLLSDCSAKKGLIDLPLALKITRGSIEGLAHAHYSGVVHGDIKPANILISDGCDPKLSDFGVARLLGTPVVRKEGSARWAAPEVLKRWNKEKVWACDYQSDLFSIGVVAYVLLTGKHPFLDEAGVLSVEEVILNDEISPGYPARPKGEIIPERYISMTMKLIQRDKKQRYTSADEALVDLQEHPMVPCTHCGEKNTEDASFCNWCGRNLKSERFAGLPPQERLFRAAHDCFTSKENEKGLAMIDEFLDVERNNVDRLCQLGYDFNFRGWYNDAIIISTKAITLDNKSTPAYQTRGFAKSNLGEFLNSIDDYTKALEHVEATDVHKKAQLHYQRGYAFMRLGKNPEACKDAREALKNEPGFEKAMWLQRTTCKSPY